MGILRKLLGRNKDKKAKGAYTANAYVYNGKDKAAAEYEYHIINEADYALMDELKAKYIAIDIETTGFSKFTDRIIELGAVKIENGTITDTFQTFINPLMHIPQEASKINHITDKMVAFAPVEKAALKKFLEFIGDAMNEGTILVAHNAYFDLEFIKRAMERCGYSGKVRVVDTLYIARRYVKGVENHKQTTVAEHFGISITNAHRAADDARVCGQMLAHMIPLLEDVLKKQEKKDEKRQITEEEYETCAVLLSLLAKYGADMKNIKLYKNSGSYIDVCYHNASIVRFKYMKKGSCIILPSNTETPPALVTEPCTKTEGGELYKRLFYKNPLSLTYLANHIGREYESAKHRVVHNIYEQNDDKMQKYIKEMSPADIEKYIASAKSKEIV
jgi:DNA polymerase III epsilon subunit family exonuclease